MPFNLSLIDDVDRADDATPPPGASWAAINGRTAGEGLVVTSGSLARLSTGSYRQGNYWSSSFSGAQVGVAVQLSSIASSEVNSSGFQLYFTYVDPGTTAPSAFSGKGFGAEFGQLDSNTLLINVGPAGSGTGSWQTTDDPAVGDTYTFTFDGTNVKVSRWRSGSETSLINHVYSDQIDGGGSFGTPFDSTLIGSPYYFTIDMMGDQAIKFERVFAGVKQILRPDADTTTTGWTSTPLWSKIGEEFPDATVISATAA